MLLKIGTGHAFRNPAAFESVVDSAVSHLAQDILHWLIAIARIDEIAYSEPFT